MMTRVVQFGDTRIHWSQDGDSFFGFTRVEHRGRLLRSGRLPWLPHSQILRGWESSRFFHPEVFASNEGLVFQVAVEFRPCTYSRLRDANLEPLLDTSDWGGHSQPKPGGVFRCVFRPDEMSLGSQVFSGFRYHWEYEGPESLHEILDRCTWELDGNIRGATVCSQTPWIDPLCFFRGEEAWTTELGQDASCELQAWPRWAVMQGFDFQAKADGLLCGLFDGVGLVRSILRRDAGADELKCFDRHIGDSGLRHTLPKRILLAEGTFDAHAWQKVWADILDESNRQARHAAGLRETPAEPFLQQDFWGPHTYDDYRKDLLPAAAALGLRHVNLSNVNRNAMTEGTRGNICCSHLYEPAPSLGGVQGLRALVDEARRLGIRLHSWTSTTQGFDSPLLQAHGGDPDWFVRMEDGRTHFGGPHTNIFYCLNLAHEPARRCWMDALLLIRDQCGLDAWFLDMFPNISFLPIHFAQGRVVSLWRQCLRAIAEHQQAGIDFDGGSTAFLRPLPGGHPAYLRPENAFLNRGMYMPCPDPDRLWTPEEMQVVLDAGAVPMLKLFYGTRRIDTLWTPAHRRVLAGAPISVSAGA